MSTILIVASVALAAVVATLFPQATTFAALTSQNAAPAAVVVATTPYQLTAEVICGGGCRASYPLVAENRRLDIKFVSCTANGTNALQLAFAFLGLNDALLTKPRHSLEWNVHDFGSIRVGEISQPVVFTVSANQRPSVTFSHTGPAPSAECTISGDLVFLS